MFVGVAERPNAQAKAWQAYLAIAGSNPATHIKTKRS